MKTQDAQRITSQFDPSRNLAVTAAASRLALAFRPVASSPAASALRAPDAVVAAVQAALLQEERCAGAATARSAEESVAAEQARSGFPAEEPAGPWADGSTPPGCSAVRSAAGTFPAQCLAAPSADDSLLADLVPDGWAPVDCSAGPSADDSLLAVCSAAWG